MPARFAPRRLARRAVPVIAALGAIILIVVLAPGLGSVREHLGEASPAWLAVAIGLEVASCISYVLLFRPVFCNRMQRRLSAEIGLSELAMGSIVPASGAGGLALGAWILRRRGMAGERIARRSVAFFMIKSSVNFVAVAVLGGLMGPRPIRPPPSLPPPAPPAAPALALVTPGLLVPPVRPR